MKKQQTITIESPPREVPILALNIDEAAESISVGKTVFKQLLADKKIKACRLGKGTKIIIAVDELKRYLSENAA